MESLKLVRQIIDFNKATFEHGFNAMVLFQDQMERAQNAFLERAARMPAETQKSFNEWAATYKKGRDNFKTFVDDGFNKVESYYTTASGTKK